MNYQIVLFKNKIKKKIIKKFITYKRADDYLKRLLEVSNSVIFERKYLNGYPCNFEISIIEKKPKVSSQIFFKDEFGRRLKVSLDDSELSIMKIFQYRIEESFLDYSTKKKIFTKDLIKKYLSGDGLKLISKLNNKIIIQNDENINLFTFKTEDDSDRFINSLSDYFRNNKRSDCMFVKDYSSAQKKYLYELLVNYGIPKNYLFRPTTTHLIKT